MTSTDLLYIHDLACVRSSKHEGDYVLAEPLNDTPKPIVDFYAISAFFDADNLNDCERMDKILGEIKSRLLTDTFYCICRESRYALTPHTNNTTHWGVYSANLAEYNDRCIDKIVSKFMGVSFAGFLLDIVGMNHQSAITIYDVAGLLESMEEERAQDETICLSYVKLARVLFRQLKWSSSYGGDSWADICCRWLDLYELDLADKTAPNYYGDAIVIVDRLIDACHNNGHCLDKIYPNINSWLRIKTSTTNPFWVVESSTIRAYCSKRLKEVFGFTRQQYCYKKGGLRLSW